MPAPARPPAPQLRICTRMNVKLVSTPFDDKNYYVNIRKAVTAGYFMQVGHCPCVPGGGGVQGGAAVGSGGALVDSYFVRIPVCVCAGGGERKRVPCRRHDSFSLQFPGRYMDASLYVNVGICV